MEGMSMWSGSYLGIGVAEIDAERARALKLPELRGVEVTKVTADSPAAKAGVQEGDVVLEYNGQRVEGIEQFMRLVRETPPGREVKLLVSRNGQTQTLTATLGNRRSFNFRFDPEFQEGMQRAQKELEKAQKQREKAMARLKQELHGLQTDLPRAMMAWRSGALGVEAESLNSQLAEFFGVKEGVLVRSVIKDSAAEKAGIKAGDVITKMDNQSVASPRDISRVIRELRPKRSFGVTVVRNRQELTLNVTVDEEPSRAFSFPMIISLPEVHVSIAPAVPLSFHF
jgi:serine protease Do